MKAQLTLTLAVITLLTTGCSNKEPILPSFTKEVANKYKDLPSWVTTDNKPNQAVGSAVYRGQSYTEQRTEAESLAFANLVRRVETKVDVLVKNHYNITGQGTNPYMEKLHAQTSSQISSMVLYKSRVIDNYIANDGELFVCVEASDEDINNITTNAEKAFSELDIKAKEYNASNVK